MLDTSKLNVSSSPHIRNEDSIRSIMMDVVIALMPALAVAIYIFGMRSFVLVCASVSGCLFFEWAYRKMLKKTNTIGDLSAVVTGILLVFCLPVSSPIWMVLVGDAFAIIIVKQLYGGIGKNFLNPALAARAFLLSWPVIMTTWTAIRQELPLFTAVDTADVVTAATPLASIKALDLVSLPSFADLALGKIPGCIGEVSALALLAGGLYLLYRKVISFHIPLCYLGTVALLTFVFPRGCDRVDFMLANLLSGGIMLGAFFMATDYTTSPVTKWGKVVFGVGCGAITVFIRYFGAYPEGCSYAILVMNACVFLIEKVTMPRKYGYIPKPKKAKGGENA